MTSIDVHNQKFSLNPISHEDHYFPSLNILEYTASMRILCLLVPSFMELDYRAFLINTRVSLPVLTPFFVVLSVIDKAFRCTNTQVKPRQAPGYSHIGSVYFFALGPSKLRLRPLLLVLGSVCLPSRKIWFTCNLTLCHSASGSKSKPLPSQSLTTIPTSTSISSDRTIVVAHLFG